MSKVETIKDWLKKIFERHWQLKMAVLIIAVSILAAVILFISRKAPKRVEMQTPAPLVEVERLKAGDIAMTVHGYGTVAAKLQVEIAPQVSGNIVWVNPQFRAGGFIPANEAIIKIDPRDYELGVQQAEAAVAETAVALDTEKAEAQVARSEWDQLNPGTEPTSPLVLRQPQIRQAEAALASAKAKLATAKLNLDRSVISLPVDVRILTAEADLGQFASAGQSVGSAYGIDAAEIEVPLENEELAWFDIPSGKADTNPGTNTTAKVSASFAGVHHTWTGYVKRTVGQVDRTSRLISVVVEIPHPFETADSRPPLVPGMFVDVEIQGETLPNAVAIPRDAIHEGNHVWLVKDDNLEIASPNIVRTDKNFAYAIGGIQDGCLLVISSIDAVTDGMKVRTQPNTANVPIQSEQDVNEPAPIENK